MILIIEVTKKPIIGRRGKTYVGICVCVWITALKFIHMNKQGNFCGLLGTSMLNK